MFFMKKVILFITLLLLTIFLTSCAEKEIPCTTNEECIPEEPLVGVKYLCVEGICKTRPLGNPADEFCLDNNFTTETRIQLDGGAYSACKFPNGNECDAWMYFRGECSLNNIVIKIDQLRFIPEELRIKAGTTVIWKNFEDEPHQVMNDPVGDYGMGDLFDSERLESVEKEGNHEYSYTFDKAGEYKYHCHIHLSMKGKIVVS